jgi:hypothetical protein
MRRPVDAERLRRFMKGLGAESPRETRVYLTGGATAVLLGWRDSTIDVDIKVDPESDAIFRALPRLKDSLEVNVELASPDQFIPPLPGWQERSPFIAREGATSFHHYDFYAQALAKIERGHDQDLGDVRQLLQRGLITPQRLRELFAEIEPLLFRYPAIDQATFRQAVERLLEDF